MAKYESAINLLFAGFVLYNGPDRPGYVNCSEYEQVSCRIFQIFRTR